MREIEVKAKLRNKEQVLHKLAELGCALSDPVSQKDTIFIKPGFTIPLPPRVTALRIRDQGGKFIFTFKQSVSNQLDCLEKEVVIGQPQEMKEIIELLGFVEFAHVNKIRRKANYKDMEICIDEVEKLGDFIEAEIITDEASDDKVQDKLDKLFEFLTSLGIQKEDQVWDGYDVLIQKLRANPT